MVYRFGISDASPTRKPCYFCGRAWNLASQSHSRSACRIQKWLPSWVVERDHVSLLVFLNCQVTQITTFRIIDLKSKLYLHYMLFLYFLKKIVHHLFFHSLLSWQVLLICIYIYIYKLYWYLFIIKNWPAQHKWKYI